MFVNICLDCKARPPLAQQPPCPRSLCSRSSQPTAQRAPWGGACLAGEWAAREGWGGGAAGAPRPLRWQPAQGRPMQSSCPPTPRAVAATTRFQANSFSQGAPLCVSLLFRKKVKSQREGPGGMLAHHGPPRASAHRLCQQLPWGGAQAWSPRTRLWAQRARVSPPWGSHANGGRWLSHYAPAEHLPGIGIPTQSPIRSPVRPLIPSLTHSLSHYLLSTYLCWARGAGHTRGQEPTWAQNARRQTGSHS